MSKTLQLRVGGEIAEKFKACVNISVISVGPLLLCSRFIDVTDQKGTFPLHVVIHLCTGPPSSEEPEYKYGVIFSGDPFYLSRLHNLLRSIYSFSKFTYATTQSRTAQSPVHLFLEFSSPSKMSWHYELENYIKAFDPYENPAVAPASDNNSSGPASLNGDNEGLTGSPPNPDDSSMVDPLYIPPHLRPCSAPSSSGDRQPFGSRVSQSDHTSIISEVKKLIDNNNRSQPAPTEKQRSLPRRNSASKQGSENIRPNKQSSRNRFSAPSSGYVSKSRSRSPAKGGKSRKNRNDSRRNTPIMSSRRPKAQSSSSSVSPRRQKSSLKKNHKDCRSGSVSSATSVDKDMVSDVVKMMEARKQQKKERRSVLKHPFKPSSSSTSYKSDYSHRR